MKRWLAVAAVCGGLLLGWPGAGDAADVPGRDVPGRDVSGRDEFMPLSQVRPGMKGTLKTVVQGTRVESFDVDVLGVLPDAGPQGDLIMIRVSDELAERAGGIASGMSGSPVYVDGRLVGAVGYGFSMSDHRLGLLTPIEAMADLYDLLDEEESDAGGSAAPESDPGTALPKTTPPGTASALPFDAWSREFKPVSIPLVGSGLSRRALDRLSADLEPYGLEPARIGGGRSTGLWSALDGGEPDGAASGPLEPGSAFGIQLARGDVGLYAIGTVTHVDDDSRFIALGHSFTHRGETAFLASRAYVHHVVTTMLSPFKLASALDTVGTVVQDRGTGVAGRLGEELPLLRMKVHVWDGDRLQDHTYETDIVRDEQFLVPLVSAVAFSGVDRALDRVGQGTARIVYRLDGEGLPRPLWRTNVTFSESDAAAMGLFELIDAVRTLADNPFEEVRLTEIDVTLDVEQERHTAQIEDARPLPRRVRPGDTVDVDVTMRAFRQGTVNERIQIEVPDDAMPGPVTVIVRAGGWAGDHVGEMENGSVDGRERITNLEMLIDRMSDRERFNDLVVEFYPPRTSNSHPHYDGGWETEPSAEDEPEGDADGPGEPDRPFPGSPERFPENGGGHAHEDAWNGYHSGERVFSTVTTPYVLTGSTVFDLMITERDIVWMPPEPPVLSPL